MDKIKVVLLRGLFILKNKFKKDRSESVFTHGTYSMFSERIRFN